MHDGELTVDDTLADRLLARDAPDLHGRPLRRVPAAGTVNTIVRLGDDLVARFPLLPTTEQQLRREAAALHEFAEATPFATPVPVRVVPPSTDYPSAWSVQTWVPGRPADPLAHADAADLARDLGALIRALRAVDVAGRGFDGRGRGGVLADHDEWVAECLARSGSLFDVAAATALWSELRSLPSAEDVVMSHRDLTPFNVLIAEDGGTRLVGVLDGGDFGPADPALDLVCAWHLFDAPVREVLRDAVDVGTTTWLRGAAWAFQQAAGLGWYYERSNPAMSALGRTTMRRLLADADLRRLI